MGNSKVKKGRKTQNCQNQFINYHSTQKRNCCKLCKVAGLNIFFNKHIANNKKTVNAQQDQVEECNHNRPDTKGKMA